MLQIHQFPCLSDNYGYLVHCTDTQTTTAIDTPDANRYQQEAKKLGWSITDIWNTHWHPDHVGGNLDLKQATGAHVCGPAREAGKIPGLDRSLCSAHHVSIGHRRVEIIDVPGHTLGHIAYHIPEEKTAFVGDTVFALGCGRVFEGDMAMMWNSMQAIRALPPETVLYCAHEYTQANARFAETVDPDNQALRAYTGEIDDKRRRNEPTVPMNLARECATNPFMRADDPALQAAMGHPGDAIATFGEIRSRKDRFQAP